MPTLLRSTSMCKGRAWTWALFVLGSLFLLSLAPAPPVAAQEPAKEAAPAAKEEAAAAPAAAPASSNESAAPKTKSLLRWALEASGPIGVFLLCLSVYFTAVVIRLFMEMRLSEAVPPALVEKLEAAIRDKKFQELYDACKDNDTFLARLVRTGVANLPNGRPEAKEAMNQVSDEIVIGMEARISYLAIIGQLGPMIGLVGTIWGMIMSFQEIATAAGSQPKPEKVAEGISTALFITLEGVALAVPAIFFFSLFRNRIAVITMEATRVADRTIASLVQAAKQAKSG
ncbi:biopolymer transport protein ExbB [Singulisphaera sp. GP187]|uniref:MotA/TolQ/ExbB proton channel family protein n=1 Tax=Singulisphaera sp. GP187 TaxID=1882752 RepID=UPI0009293F66|nr:MotA/TolQ/ExbB proton channel family protein [Singulisphaera sp. GP187]SIN81569.1 biopolymer transport protein ExbB [Singulisphaera sp. GP187]